MIKKISLLSLCLCLSLASFGVVHAVSITDAQSAAISSSCASIKSSLRSNQYLDARTRSYYGKYYETILTDYMIPLGTRLLRSSQLDPELTAIQSDFTSSRAQFNSDYVSYSQAYESLISTDCAAHPEEFYSQLSTVRDKRQILRDDISSLEKIIDRFRSSVKTLQESYGK